MPPSLEAWKPRGTCAGIEKRSQLFLRDMFLDRRLLSCVISQLPHTKNFTIEYHHQISCPAITPSLTYVRRILLQVVLAQVRTSLRSGPYWPVMSNTVASPWHHIANITPLFSLGGVRTVCSQHANLTLTPEGILSTVAPKRLNPTPRRILP